MRVKNGIDYFEFRDGFAVTTKVEVMAVIAGYRERRLKRNELRLFAARMEQKALHKKSKVDLARILNCKSGANGVRRLSNSPIAAAGSALDSALLEQQRASSGPSRAVLIARPVLRHIAQGRCTSNEAVVLLYYMVRRIRQSKSLQRLKPGERYARFTYGELQRLSGIPRANISRAVARLKRRGWLNTVDVAKRNENVYGQLFVDGPLVSLSGARRPVNKRTRKRRPDEQNDNTPLHETTTLIKKYDPKSKIRLFDKEIGEKRPCRLTLSDDFERIKQRANQMRAEWMEQAA